MNESTVEVLAQHPHDDDIVSSAAVDDTVEKELWRHTPVHRILCERECCMRACSVNVAHTDCLYVAVTL